MRKIIWTKEKCMFEALKYETRYQFQLKSKGAYSAAFRNKWLDEICSHMNKTGNWYNRCIYAYEFSDNHVYIGLTYNLNERNFNRHKNSNDAVTKYVLLTKLKPKLIQLTDYIDVNLASKLEIQYIDEYKNNGWIILNIAKGGTVGNSIHKLTYDECKVIAINYLSRNEFKKNNRSTYEIARKNGWLNSICLHMKPLLKYWTFELCREEALKYKTRTKFHDNCNGAYKAALRNNWLNIIFDK